MTLLTPDVVDEEARFLEAVLHNESVVAVLERGERLGLPDWYLTAGCLFQTVWNLLGGHSPTRGIRDYDLFYFDAADLSWGAEDVAIKQAADAFTGLGITVEVRNQARVHLWYEQKFGRSCPQFTSSADAIDHFAATACCVGVRREADNYRVHAPFGFTDLFGRVLRPNPVLAPREVFERKVERWTTLWPDLVVLPWPSSEQSGR